MAYSSVGVPVGSIVPFIGNPDMYVDGAHWQICDGRPLNIKDYPELAATLDYAFGGSAGNGTFNVPDLRGMFLRGIDTKGVVDPDFAERTDPIAGSPNVVGAVVGSRQDHQVLNHLHTTDTTVMPLLDSNPAYTPVPMILDSPNTVPAGGNAVADIGGGGNETRPANVYVYYLICGG